MSDNNYISIMNIIDGTVVDGPGFRISIYCAGCRHHCKGCHNQQSWEISNGRLYSIDNIFKQIKESPWNVTFSGGDPFFQASEFARLARRIKAETDKTIWCYTGFTLESLINENNPDKIELLSMVDVLVDGPYIQELRDESLRFRGSSNQRIIENPLGLAVVKEASQHTKHEASVYKAR